MDGLSNCWPIWLVAFSLICIAIFIRAKVRVHYLRIVMLFIILSSAVFFFKGGLRCLGYL